MALYSRTYTIFWQPPTWYLPPNFTQLIARYFGDVGGSSLYNIMTQYYQTAYGQNYFIQNNSAYAGSYIDTTPYPTGRCTNPVTGSRCLLDSDIQLAVTRAMSNKGWSGGNYNMFFVYTAYGEGSCETADCKTGVKASYKDYCAYHSSFYNTQKAAWVIYSNMPYSNTGNPNFQPCNSVPSSPNGNRDIDNEITTTSHEHFESVTDPYPTVVKSAAAAWYDNAGQEIGDKCARIFGALSYGGGTANQYWHGHLYVVQTEFSNKAFYQNVGWGGVAGCLQYG